MLKAFEVSYSIRGDTGPSRTAVVIAIDTIQAKKLIVDSHMTAITNVTFHIFISLTIPSIYQL